MTGGNELMRRPMRKRCAPDLGSLRRDEILAVAARLLETRGYDGLSMGRIAKEAGYARQTVYDAVGGKGGLLAAIVNAFMERIEPGVAALPAGSAAEALVEAALSRCAANPWDCALARVALDVRNVPWLAVSTRHAQDRCEQVIAARIEEREPAVTPSMVLDVLRSRLPFPTAESARPVCRRSSGALRRQE